MTTNRMRLFGGAILTGALLVGTAGLAFAQDPTNPSDGPGTMPGGSGMMGGQGVTGGFTMMDGVTTGGSMNAAMDTMHASMTADQVKAMGTMHASMSTRGMGDARGR